MRHATGAAVLLLGCAAYLLITACGWGRSPTSPSLDVPGPTVTITASGLSQPAIAVPVGGRLTIVNRDGVAHEMVSTPPGEQGACPALNRIGVLQPGDARASGTLGEAGTCGMHDRLRPLDATWHLEVTIR
jgi:hypothetical protein